MDSQNAISTLQALRNTLADGVVGQQAQVDALDVAFTLLNEGYKIDQARIDTEIQAGRDAVAAEIADKDTQITTLTAQVTDLASENEALKNPPVGIA